MDANGQHQTRLTFTDEQELTPAWSPNGNKIAFYSNPSDDLTGLYTMNPTGAGRKQITSGELDLDPSWSLDSSKIAFSRRVPSKGDHISVVAATGGTVTNLTGDILTTGEVDPLLVTRRSKKILFSHLGGGGLVTINPNGTGRTPFPSGDSSDLHGDWGTATSCPDVKVGFATAQGCFTETAPGSGFFETEQKAGSGALRSSPAPAAPCASTPTAPASRPRAPAPT